MKFKPGDRVIYKKESSMFIGCLGTIINTLTNGVYVVRVEGYEEYNYTSPEFQLDFAQPYLNEQKLKKVLGL